VWTNTSVPFYRVALPACGVLSKERWKEVVSGGPGATSGDRDGTYVDRDRRQVLASLQQNGHRPAVIGRGAVQLGPSEPSSRRAG